MGSADWRPNRNTHSGDGCLECPGAYGRPWWSHVDTHSSNGCLVGASPDSHRPVHYDADTGHGSVVRDGPDGDGRSGDVNANSGGGDVECRCTDCHRRYRAYAKSSNSSMDGDGPQFHFRYGHTDANSGNSNLERSRSGLVAVAYANSCDCGVDCCRSDGDRRRGGPDAKSSSRGMERCGAGCYWWRAWRC